MKKMQGRVAMLQNQRERILELSSAQLRAVVGGQGAPINLPPPGKGPRG